MVDEEMVYQALTEITEIAVEHIRAREAVPAPLATGDTKGGGDVVEKLTMALEAFLAAVRGASGE